MAGLRAAAGQPASPAKPNVARGLLKRRRVLRGRSGDQVLLRLGALLDRAHFPAQTERGVDQTDVAEGLRKIAQHAARERIELLGQQANVVAARKQSVEQLAGFGVAPLQDVIVEEPK